jgi:hypothetical protein
VHCALTFAIHQQIVAVHNGFHEKASAGEASVGLRALALPQSAPVDARSFPIFSGRPGPAPPPLTVSPGETRTVSSLLQLPFEVAQPVNIHAVAQSGGVTATADVPLTLTVAGWSQRLKIELHADSQQWCALLAAMTARGPGLTMQGSPSTATAGAAWAARFLANLPTRGPLTLRVFVGGQEYETATRGNHGVAPVERGWSVAASKIEEPWARRALRR